MAGSNLQGVANEIVERARRQGYIVAKEVREELARVQLAETLWKDVVALARPSLSYRRGRYYYSPPVSDRVLAEQSHQREIQTAVQQIVAQYQTGTDRIERREQGRIDFIQPVKVVTEDNRTHTLLTRDLSVTGIRLLGTRRLLGQKLHVFLPVGPHLYDFAVRILWTCPIGEDLVENGGTFLSVTPVVS